MSMWSAKQGDPLTHYTIVQTIGVDGINSQLV